MENASKALLIAGAILLVIAIIAIAMSILNQGQDVTTKVQGQFDTLVVQSHNSQFTSYAQIDKLTKVQAIELISKVASSNNKNSQLYGGTNNPYNVTLTGITTTAALTSQFYTVTVNVDATSGIITEVTLNAVTNPAI